MFFFKNSFSAFFPVLAVLFFFFSCRNGKQRDSLYPIDSLVGSQIRFLSMEKASLRKEAIINEKIERTALIPKDTVAWGYELGIFEQLDIMNKPVSSKSYLITDGLFDPGSNLTVKEFSTEKDIPVKYLRVFYHESLARPRKIEAFFRSGSLLSKTARILTMEFGQYDNKTVLTSYSVEGGQKMIFGDTVEFTIKGKITFD